MKTAARGRIRDAAINLFAEKGYAATTTREICERAGVTKPVLYYHFENKERLYRELILDACNESHKQLLLALERDGSTREKLINVLTSDFALTMRDPKLSTMFLRMVFPTGESEPGISSVEMATEWVRLVEGVVSEGIRQREFRGKAKELAEAVMGIHLIYTMSYVLTGRPKLDRKLAQRVINLLVDGCSNHTDR